LQPLFYVWMSFLILLMGCGTNDTETDMETSIAQPGVDPYCDTRPQFGFCEDFDVRALPGVFDEQLVQRAQMTIDNEASLSPPGFLLVLVESGGQGALRHTFEPGGKLRLFGFFYVPELGIGETEIGAFELEDYRVAFGVSADGSLWAQIGGERIAGEGTIPVERWASFRWDVNLYDDGTGTAKLRFGNEYIVNTDTLTPPIASASSPRVTVGLSEATGAWRMRFDNLTIEVGQVNP
jgi:hypothetical protein